MGDPKTHGAFPRSLRRFARQVPQPYKVAFQMAADEIEELREFVGFSEDQAQNAAHSSWTRDCKAPAIKNRRKRIRR